MLKGNSVTDIEIAKTLGVFFNPDKGSPKWGAIDKIEEYMVTKPRMYGELTERGTPGLYSRELLMPAGMLCTSRIHKTCHQFVVSEGAISVYNTFGDTQDLFTSGHHGITYPGTRRVLYAHEDTRWVTFHPTHRITPDFFNLDNAEKQIIFTLVMEDLIQDYYNPLIDNFDEGVFI